MNKRTNEKIKEDNIEYNKNQMIFMDFCINELSKILKNYNFTILWKKDNTSLNTWNNSFWNENYKSIHFIFQVLLNNKKYIFFVSIKSGNNFSYEFARNKRTNHSLRKYHVRKKTCTYDEYTCTKLVEIVRKTSKSNIFGFIYTQNNVKNNPKTRDSAIFYRDQKIILGNIDNLRSYLLEIGFML